MAKKKVIEFAHGIGLSPNEVIKILKGTEFEVKNKDNTLYDKAQEYVLQYIEEHKDEIVIIEKEVVEKKEKKNNKNKTKTSKKSNYEKYKEKEDKKLDKDIQEIFIEESIIKEENTNSNEISKIEDIIQDEIQQESKDEINNNSIKEIVQEEIQQEINNDNFILDNRKEDKPENLEEINDNLCEDINEDKQVYMQGNCLFEVQDEENKQNERVVEELNEVEEIPKKKKGLFSFFRKKDKKNKKEKIKEDFSIEITDEPINNELIVEENIEDSTITNIEFKDINEGVKSFDELKDCENEEVIEKTIENRKTQIVVDDITIKILEEQIIDLNKQILDIQDREKAQIQKHIDEVNKQKEELDKECQRNKEELDNEIKRLEESHKERMTLLEEEFEKKNKETEDVKNEYQQKAINLEEEYLGKKKELEDEYNSKNEKLEQDFQEKLKALEEDFNTRQKDFEEECNARTTFLDDYEKDVYENCDKKTNEVNEKIKKSKEEFEAFMEEQKKLFNEQIALKNEERQKEYDELDNKLKEKEFEINADYNQKLQNLKQEELSIVQKETELNEKISDLNNKVKDFNDSREKFINKYYLTKNIYRKVKNNKKKLIGGGVVCAILFCYFFLVFEYTLSKNSFISASITNRQENEKYSDTFTIALDTSKSSLMNLTELDGLTLKLNYKFNKDYYESLNDYNLSYGNSDYKWKRFYKDDAMIMKSPFYGQYVVVDNFKEKGYSFKNQQEIDIFLDSFREYISKLRNRDFVECSRLNVNGNNSFFTYLKQIFTVRSDYNYYYSIENTKHAQKLFEGCFETFINSSNFVSFEKEEADIQEALRYGNVLSGVSDILKNIVKYSTVKNCVTNIKILEGNEINMIDVLFELDYQDSTMVSSIPMSIRFSCNFDNLEEDTTLEEDDFTMNAIYYESLMK